MKFARAPSTLHVSCEGVAAASAGEGGGEHVAAFAVLEEADAGFVEVYVDVAHARGGGALQEVAPNPQGGGLARLTCARFLQKGGPSLGAALRAAVRRHALRAQNEGRLVALIFFPGVDAACRVLPERKTRKSHAARDISPCPAGAFARATSS